MAMAMYVAMWMDLERPYWALVSAVFLQVRPEAGMVLEKTVCQILGTLIGGAFAMVVLHYFHAYSGISLFCLALWTWLNSGLSSLVRRVNFIYFFAMACVTPCIIILLTMATPSAVSSQSIFDIAQSRISELIVGSVCAMLVSLILWPQRVEKVLVDHAKNTINQTMAYLSVELDPDGSHDERHKHIDDTLQSLTALSDDSSAVVFEGPDGPGKSRAATVICNKILSLIAVVQIFGRLQRNNPELLSENMMSLLTQLRNDVGLIGSLKNFDECYELAQKQRRKWSKLFQSDQLTTLEFRLCRTAQEMVADLVVILRAYRALERGEKSTLKASGIKPHRDWLVAVTTGFRTCLVFSTGAFLWVGTGSPAAIMLMILPVIFSIMFARLAPVVVTRAIRGVLIGACFAIPVAIFYALNLIAASSGDFAILVLILSGPLFLGLMLLSHRAFLPYGIGFCIPFVILVQPANDMSRSLSVDYTTSSALAILSGVMILYWIFKLFAGPGANWIQSRLLSVTYQDLLKIGSPGHDEDWFNARMCDRLLRLTSYEQNVTSGYRTLTDLGLTGLNLGHASMRIRRLMSGLSERSLTGLEQEWQQALAASFLAASKGDDTDLLAPVNKRIIDTLKAEGAPEENLALIDGIFTRLHYSFRRTATMIKEARA
ncbi:MAG: fusaric acid resistance protein [Alteromonadaceae bacterium]|nr:fusaric acid resistance protein [Alteromonadaceae bacterium]